MDNNKKEGLILLILGLLLMILIVLMNNFDIKLICLFNYYTGLLCPGCGVTRMLKSLFKLEIKKAFWYNSLVFCLLPFIGIYFLDRVLVLLCKRKSFLPDKLCKLFWDCALIIAIIFAVLRNIPFFDFLRP